MAKLLFIGPRKGRVILISRLCRRLRRGAALAQQLPGQQQPFLCQVSMHGLPRLLPEPAHHVVLADLKPRGQFINGQRVRQVQVQVLQQ